MLKFSMTRVCANITSKIKLSYFRLSHGFGSEVNRPIFKSLKAVKPIVAYRYNGPLKQSICILICSDSIPRQKVV